MPDHIHGILEFEGTNQHRTLSPMSLQEVIRWFKVKTTNAYIHGVRECGWPRFDRRLWQRGFYDRVIRDEDERMRARGYTSSNPARWEARYGPEM